MRLSLGNLLLLTLGLQTAVNALPQGLEARTADSRKIKSDIAPLATPSFLLAPRAFRPPRGGGGRGSDGPDGDTPPGGVGSGDPDADSLPPPIGSDGRSPDTPEDTDSPPVHIGQPEGDPSAPQPDRMHVDEGADAYRQKGQKVEQEIDDVIASQQPDKTTRALGDNDPNNGNYANIDDGYDSIIHPEQTLMDAGRDGSHIFQHELVNLDPNMKLIEVEVKAKGRGDNVGDNAYNVDNGVIVALVNDARNDPKIKTDAQRLTFSELVWQTWQKQAGDKAGDLRFIIRNSVSGDGSINTIQRAHEKMNFPLDKPAVFERSSPDPLMKEAFQELMGTDNARSAAFITKDHSQALGGKRIEKIVTWSDDVDPEEFPGGAMMALILEKNA